MTITIPESPSELEEMLNDNTKLAEIFQSGPEIRNEFFTRYAAHQMTKDGGELGKLIDESSAAAVAKLLRTDKKTARKLNLSPLNDGVPSPHLGTGAVRNAAYNPNLATAQLDGTYSGLGDLAQDVQRYRSGRDPKNRDGFDKVVQVTNAYSEIDPSTGGFLVPEETRSTLLQLALEQSIVRPRATVITMGSLTTSIPFVDATTNVGSVFGGMQFYWVGESGTITPTEAKFGRVKLEANKLVGGARIPNELWADASALSTWLDAAAPMGIAYYEDNSFISGSGAGQPLGIREAGCKITAARAGANALTTGDLYGMFARMLPQSLGSAVWLVNQTLLPKLFDLTTGSGGYPLGIVNIANSPFPTLLGRPMIVTEKVPALGSADDIMFVDFKYYLVGDRQAISVDYSKDSRFMNDETELRIIERVDGRPWVENALTPLNGDTVSPVVGIDAS